MCIIFIKSLVFHAKNTDCRSPPSMSTSYHSSRITPPGKPSTWFPGERLVTQVALCLFLSIMFLKWPLTSENSAILRFIRILYVFKFDLKFAQFETSLGIDFFRGLTFSPENLCVITVNISN